MLRQTTKHKRCTGPPAPRNVRETEKGETSDKVSSAEPPSKPPQLHPQHQPHPRPRARSTHLLALVPIEPLAIHVRPLPPQIPLKRPLKHRTPTQIPLVLVNPFVLPIELVEIPLIVPPPLLPLDRRRPYDGRLSWFFGLRRTGSVGGGGSGRAEGGGESGELGGEESAAGEALSGDETGAEVGEVARGVEGDPPARASVARTERREGTHQKLWKW